MKACQEFQNEENKVRPRKKNILITLKATCLMQWCWFLESWTRPVLGTRNLLSWQQHHTTVGGLLQQTQVSFSMGGPARRWCQGECVGQPGLPLVLQPHQWRGYAESRPKERKNIFLVSIQKSKHRKCLNPAKSNQHNPIKPNPTTGKHHMPTSPAVIFYFSGLYSLSFRHCQPAQNCVKLWEFKQVVTWYEKAWGW